MNKLTKLGLITIAGLTLAACGQGQGASDSSESNSATATTTKKEKSNNGILEEVGQTSTRDGATMTLDKITKVEDSHEIADGVTVENVEVKVMSVDKINKDYGSMYESLGINEGDKMIQITYDMKNDTPYTLQNINLLTTITSTGEQISMNDTFGDYELLSGGKTHTTGAFSKINDPEIDGVSINWDMYSEENDYTPLETSSLDIQF